MAKSRSLSSVTTAQVGLAFPIYRSEGARRFVAMQVHPTGEPTGGQVILEGSINGNQYFTLGSWTAGSDPPEIPVVSDGVPVRFVRAQCTSPPSGGSSPTFSADIAWSE